MRNKPLGIVQEDLNSWNVFFSTIRMLPELCRLFSLGCKNSVNECVVGNFAKIVDLYQDQDQNLYIELTKKNDRSSKIYHKMYA